MSANAINTKKIWTYKSMETVCWCSQTDLFRLWIG